MKGFEVINSAVRAYRFVWNNRQMVVRYGLFPFIAKLGCFSALVLMGMEDDILRQGLFMLPAYFAEGAVVCLLIRLAIDSVPQQGHLFGAKSFRDVSPSIFEQKKILTAGTILYVLVQMAIVLIAYGWMMFLGVNGGFEEQQVAPSPQVAMASIVMFGLLMWGVRLAWVYVPVVMGYRILRYLRVFSSFSVSLYMVGVMLVCSVPVMFVMWIVLQLLASAFGMEGGDSSGVVLIVFGALSVLASLVTTILTSLGIAYAVYPLLSGQKIEEEA